MLPGGDRIAEPGVVGEVNEKVGSLLGHKPARQPRHQILIANKGGYLNP